ncbi:hypothetical protein AAG747_23380 [Rapidithrix thailandica]|uniref:Uncharacterized protein n=1 Tax=Rapidithrix thailandica TaxID=413964 RepID=A0AAW9SBR2_9BACT
MKFWTSILSIIILVVALELVLPWWSIGIAACIGGLLNAETPAKNFLIGFTGVFLVWTAYALFIDFNTSSILSGKVGELLFLPSPILLALVTGLLGGIVGGFSCLTGRLLKAVVKN